jgi:hypothetical protein
MRIAYLLLLLALLLPGCSKKSLNNPPADGNKPHVSSNHLPFEVQIVETEQDKEWRELASQSLTYFQKQDYDALENLAEQGRSANDAWPSGNWRVVPVYNGLELSDAQAESVWLARQNALQAWVKDRPESITARVALARHLVNYAWKARGLGFANTVSDKGEQLFEERLQQAQSVLSEANNLTERCPVYWSTLMKIGLGLRMDRDEYDRIYQQAMAAYPDYTPAYVQRAIFLLPRWYGAKGEWVTDLTKMADKIGGEKGDILYAQVAWSMHGFSDKKNIFTENEELSWDRVNRGWDALEKEFPDSLNTTLIHAHLAALAGDREKAKECLMKTEGKVTLSAWDSKEEFIDFANWTFAQ